MQGYADLNSSTRPIQHMVAYVAAPTPLAASIQQSIAEQAQKRGILAEDAFNLLPPTRTYTDAEIRQILAQRNVDSVLVIQVGDSGATKEYAGTIMTGQYTGTSSATGTINTFGNMSTLSASGMSSGTMTATATPTYRYSRRTAFTARLIALPRHAIFGSGTARWMPAAFCSSAMA
jgi:hypothetical protein